uniref:U104-Liphistoxin-Lsp1a_1 n=1 Tax=Liphistius sp. SGP-2016 TaxID=1905180 RepID=A0A4V2H922_9ARAC
MKGTELIILGLVAVASCWEFPGHPGTDCEETREYMQNAEKIYWMIPECNEDRTFVPMQCFENTDICMCVLPDGSPLTLPGFVNVTACDCFLELYKADSLNLIGSYIPQCENDGTYKAKQCHGSTGYCWCVDKKGTLLTEKVPPGHHLSC